MESQEQSTPSKMRVERNSLGEITVSTEIDGEPKSIFLRLGRSEDGESRLLIDLADRKSQNTARFIVKKLAGDVMAKKPKSTGDEYEVETPDEADLKYEDKVIEQAKLGLEMFRDNQSQRKYLGLVTDNIRIQPPRPITGAVSKTLAAAPEVDTGYQKMLDIFNKIPAKAPATPNYKTIIRGLDLSQK